MGNGASLLSPGKKRAQQQRTDVEVVEAEATAPAPPPSSADAVAPASTPSAVDEASRAHELPEDDEVDLREDESEWLSDHADDALSFLRAQHPDDAYADFTLALALELEQDFDAARWSVDASGLCPARSHAFVVLSRASDGGGSRLFRSALGHRGLGLSAHYHLALCLLRGPTGSAGSTDGRDCSEDEAVRCLERVVGAESAPEGDDEAWPLLLRNSKVSRRAARWCPPP